MRLVDLNISNFQSLGNIHFEFPTGLVLIDGWNADLGSHNGVGKSALLNAITFAIYGRTPKDIKLEELVRNGADNMSVEIVLESKGNDIKITRSRTRKSGKTILVINGDEVSGLAKDIEARIPDLIGLTFEQFCQVVYVFQGADNRFITLNDTEKKKFLSTLLNLDVYDNAYKVAHARLNATELELANLSGKVESTEKQIGSLVTQAEENRKEMEDFEKAKDSQVASLMNKVKHIKGELKELELLKIQASKSAVLDGLIAQKGKVEVELANLQKLETGVANVEKCIYQIDNDIKKAVTQRDNPSNRCSQCGQSLPGWDTDAHKQAYNDKIAELENSKSVCKSQLKAFQESLRSKPEAIQIRDSLLEQIAVEKAKGPDRFDPQISLKKNELQGISQEVVALEQRGDIHKKALNKVLLCLEEARNDLGATRVAIGASEQKKTYLLALKNLFGPVGVRAYVFDGIVREINDRVSGYLDTLSGGCLRWGLTSDDTKGKFTETCQYNGIDRSVAALSGGEFRRLSLAVDLALADVVCGRVGTYPNLLILDEAFEGLDISGREAVTTLLTELAARKDAVYCIDHASEMKANFGRTFKLVKKNGVTQEESAI